MGHIFYLNYRHQQTMSLYDLLLEQKNERLASLPVYKTVIEFMLERNMGITYKFEIADSLMILCIGAEPTCRVILIGGVQHYFVITDYKLIAFVGIATNSEMITWTIKYDEHILQKLMSDNFIDRLSRSIIDGMGFTRCDELTFADLLPKSTKSAMSITSN